ncbi:MAG: NAD-dependent epimerase [Bacteroidales bacterium]|nr:NAD-dependent epimerase [Bacteroidales bacterium]
MKILITGTAGFIGFHTAKKFIAAGFNVTGLDSINDYYDKNLKYARLAETGIEKSEITYAKLVQSNKYKNYHFIELQIEDKDEILKLFSEEKFDYICHLAAQAGVRYSIENPYVYFHSNINGFLNIIEASKRNNIKHLVYASSSSVYGLNEEMPFSTSHNVDHPVSLYAATKKSDELIAHAYSHLFKLPTTGLRFFTVYGPWGRPDMALFLFTKAILADKPINVYNNGDMMRDFTYVDDIVEGIFRVVQKPAAANPEWSGKTPDPANSSALYKIYNIGNGSPVQLLDYIKAAEKALGKKAKKKFLPMQPGDVQKTYADVKSLIKDFDYKPDTSIEEGVAKFIEWYKTYYNIN